MGQVAVAQPARSKPTLTARLIAWEKAYGLVGATLQGSLTEKDGTPPSPGAILDIATTAAQVAAQLVAGAELE